LFPVDIDRHEQLVNKTCKNIVENLFIVGNTTFMSISTEVDFTPVHILYNRGQWKNHGNNIPEVVYDVSVLVVLKSI
jgi:hypothetical protein